MYNPFIQTSSGSVTGGGTNYIFLNSGYKRTPVGDDFKIDFDTNVTQINMPGNLTVTGTTTHVNDIVVDDAIVTTAYNNSGDAIKSGILNSYTSSGLKYAGLVRNAGGKFYLVKDETSDTESKLALTTFDDLKLGSIYIYSSMYNGANTGAFTLPVSSSVETLLSNVTSNLAMNNSLSNSNGSTDIDFSVNSLSRFKYLGLNCPADANYALISNGNISLQTIKSSPKVAEVINSSLMLIDEDNCVGGNTSLGIGIKFKPEGTSQGGTGYTQIGDTITDKYYFQGYIAGVSNNAIFQLRYERRNGTSFQACCWDDQKLKIGSGTPSEALDVVGNIKLSGYLTTGTYNITMPSVTGTMLTTAGNSALTGTFANAGGTSSIDCSTNSLNRLDHLGIGAAASASYGLYCTNNDNQITCSRSDTKLFTVSNSAINMIDTSEASTNYGQRLRFTRSPETTAIENGYVNRYCHSVYSTDSKSDSEFRTCYTTVGGSATPVFYIKKDKVGINMTPTQALSVTGNISLSGTMTNGTYTYTMPSATGTLALTSQLPINYYIDVYSNATFSEVPGTDFYPINDASIVTNQSSGFSNSNGVITVTNAGKYLVTYSIVWSSDTVLECYFIYGKSSALQGSSTSRNSVATLHEYTNHASFIYDMAASDATSLYFKTTTASATIYIAALSIYIYRIS